MKSKASKIKNVICFDPGQTAGAAIVNSSGEIFGFSRKVGKPGAHVSQTMDVYRFVFDAWSRGPIGPDMVVLNTNPFRQIAQTFSVRDFMAGCYARTEKEPSLMHDNHARKLLFGSVMKKEEAHLILYAEYDLSQLDGDPDSYITALTGDPRQAKKMTIDNTLDAVIGALARWIELGVDVKEWQRL